MERFYKNSLINDFIRNVVSLSDSVHENFWGIVSAVEKFWGCSEGIL